MKTTLVTTAITMLLIITSASAYLAHFAIINGTANVTGLLVTNASLVTLSNGCNQKYDFPFKVYNLTVNHTYNITIGCKYSNPPNGWNYAAIVSEIFPNATKPNCSGSHCPSPLFDSSNINLNTNITTSNFTVYKQFPTNGTIEIQTKASGGSGTCAYTCFAVLNKVS